MNSDYYEYNMFNYNNVYWRNNCKKLNFNVLYITYFSMIIGFAIGYFLHDKIRKNNNKKLAK